MAVGGVGQERTLGLGGAVTLNLLDMIGVGPFITLPLLVGAMGGPQAMLGWILGALLAVCDGMVWAELGAAMPEAGGRMRTCGGSFRAAGAVVKLSLCVSVVCVGAFECSEWMYRVGAVCGGILASAGDADGGACGGGGTV